MICKHVQDPIKAWRRERQKGNAGAQISKTVAVVEGPTAITTKKGSETGTMTYRIKLALLRKSLQLFRKTQKGLQEPETEVETVPTTQQTEIFFPHDSLQLLQRTQKKVQSPANGNQCISVFFCSAGTVAEKLANKVHGWLSNLVKGSTDLQLRSRVEPLNSLNVSNLTVGNILLIIVSSTGQGEIPANGLGLPRLCKTIFANRLMDRTQGFRFAVFGNGDSRYSATYNGAAIKINDHLTQVGGHSLAVGVFQADTAIAPLPLSALKSWLDEVQPSIINRPIERLATAVVRSATNDRQLQTFKRHCIFDLHHCTSSREHTAVFVKVKPVVELGQKYEDYQDRLLSTLGKASLVGTASGMHEGKDGSFLATFDVHNDQFEEMNCIQILPSNAPTKVNQALRSLCVKRSDHVNLGLNGKDPTYLSFLTDYVDLELPFSDVECLEAVEFASHRGLSGASLSRLPAHEVLGRLHGSIVWMNDEQRCAFMRDMCEAMSLLHTRTYSIASSPHYRSSRTRANGSAGRELDIMVKSIPGGRFSDTFMKESTIPASLRYRIVDSPSGATIRKHHLRPFVIVATGAGFGPVRCLLQWRISIIRDALATGQQSLPGRGSKISLFLGLKPPDVQLTLDVLNEAMALNLIDVLDIVLSNATKCRVYESLLRCPQCLRDKLLRRQGMAFVCTNRAAALATKGVFESVLGGCVGEMLGERYVEEVF